MLNLKKLYSDELLQLALLLSLLRVDPDSYLGLDIRTIGVGSLDLNNGSGWHTDSHTIVHRPAFIHPKNLDSVLLNYERDLFEDLNLLGRYNRINAAHNDIHAYLLNIDDRAGPSVRITDASNNATNTTSAEPPMPSQAADENQGAAELTQEDMDLIEVLWKQDVDLGFTLVDPTPTAKIAATSSKKESEDDIEKLKTLEAINAANDKKTPDIKEEPSKEDPWAGLPYTVDLETGEYILNAGSSSSENSDQRRRREEHHLLGLGAVEDLVGLGEDSLGLNDSLGLENDFTSELLGDDCLLDGCAAVDGFLGNDTLGLPDGFNLEEALQLVGLDEAQLEKPEVKKKSDEDSDGARSDSRASTSEDNEEESSPKEAETDSMIHTPQYHHPHHPHHRSFQSRVPFVRTVSMEQRWPDIAPFFSVPGGTEHFAHPGHHHHHHHHHHHPSYTSLGAGTTHHGHYEASAAAAAAAAAAQRNVLLHNATLAPPVGDLNSTGSYHNAGGPSNLGSAVATSMNLTNSNETMGGDNGTGYKSEPNEMMYYPSAATDTMNQTTDSIFSALLDEQLGWNNEDLAFNVSDGLYGGASGATGATATLPGVQGAGASATVVGPGATSTTATAPDERMDASSDSAVSSMGSERVPSLSDGEWMETGSNSSHTQADSHYSMDYTGKYRMPYDCGYSLTPGRPSQHQRGCHAAAERASMAPVAQKKHHMFGKRCFQEQGPMSGAAGSPLPLAASSAHHPAAATPMKYDYEAAQTVAAGPPGQAYSGPIEGAAGPQSEIKYSCSLDFGRHQNGRSNLEHVHHNHTYHLPPESTGSLQRPISRDKKGRKSEGEEHLTRDEKRARALNVPIAVSDIINLPMDEFNERLSKYDLSEAQLSLIRDIRRRGKNKVAAQNCRKRKLDQINSLSDEVKEMRNRKMRLLSERNYMLQEVARVKEKFGQLYRHIFHVSSPSKPKPRRRLPI
ncbi:PREDICTED: segmentation protein cap'n'collar isoform X2 [Ceratosolen solmsi marchali]|uniref:Segmentation protein cap'n'collar isoform X2 n=1 Tax=Ceratosolen solmsi marchali TaxID=326594 RepID=A0AAJ7E228_9HYME|nr:PREDICTED: segmentation protein cap'n'collar isoform X2 [Ceratosolen solmsi marchali]